MNNEQATEQTTAAVSQEVPLNADNAAKIIGDYLESQEQKGRWHMTMGKCLAYLHKKARESEDYISATNQPDLCQPTES